MFARQPGERRGNVLQIGFDQRQALADLQHGCRVGDDLRGRAPVSVLARLVPAIYIDLVDDGDDGVADLLGLGLEFGPVDLVDSAVFDDVVGGFLRDQCIRVIEGPS